ncbi:MAG: hypothetical protein NVS1B6_03490 [Steroidobacteraceae bacterium]
MYLHDHGIPFIGYARARTHKPPLYIVAVTGPNDAANVQSNLERVIIMGDGLHGCYRPRDHHRSAAKILGYRRSFLTVRADGHYWINLARCIVTGPD